MFATDFDRTRGTACELCPAPIVTGQQTLLCAGCAKRVHEHCLSYVLDEDPKRGLWCCSNCRDGRPKRPLDPNLSLRTGSARTRKAPDTYQVGEIRQRRSRTATPPMVSVNADTSSGATGMTTVASEAKLVSEPDQVKNVDNNGQASESLDNGGMNAESTRRKRSKSESEKAFVALSTAIPSEFSRSSMLTRSRRKIGLESDTSAEPLAEIQ